MKKTVHIGTEVSSFEKAAYKKYWQAAGFSSESDALRYHIREVTGWSPMMAAEGKTVKIQESPEIKTA